MVSKIREVFVIRAIMVLPLLILGLLCTMAAAQPSEYGGRGHGNSGYGNPSSHYDWLSPGGMYYTYSYYYPYNNYYPYSYYYPSSYYYTYYYPYSYSYPSYWYPTRYNYRYWYW